MALPERNMDWTEVAKLHASGCSPDVELVRVGGGNRVYVFCRHGHHDAVVCWDGRFAREAQMFLDRIAFMRCERDGCGVRVGIKGGSCGNHPEDRP